jgi:hypothetical protein
MIARTSMPVTAQRNDCIRGFIPSPNMVLASVKRLEIAALSSHSCSCKVFSNAARTVEITLSVGDEIYKLMTSMHYQGPEGRA